ncbi:hypothetical protein scyTo_0007346 [Scyliorhinus torazame]|uniref:Secreted protein n=1 Tax=Scyliorhinus torazame TaxID=75743 RepID=A0A401NQM2_SCYTO|nr:hypothetical protein [Scyliorhinus torazame]
MLLISLGAGLLSPPVLLRCVNHSPLAIGYGVCVKKLPERRFLSKSQREERERERPTQLSNLNHFPLPKQHIPAFNRDKGRQERGSLITGVF